MNRFIFSQRLAGRMNVLQALVLTSVLAVFLAACNGDRAGRESIRINGSDTEVNLVQSLAERYMEINDEVPVSVTGGGSGTGIAAIINRQTDIANSSRAMSESEIQQAHDRGVEPVGIVFAIDGLAVIVNEGIDIESLTIDEVGRIYRGDIRNWSEVGGPDRNISLYGRQSNSGTYIYFRNEVVKADYSPSMMNMNGTAQIVEGVRNDRSGIGYVGIGYVVDNDGEVISGIRVLSIAVDAETEAASPLDSENVRSGLYPISRPLYQYTNGVPTGSILAFIRWELSEEGQEIVASTGYYPVSEEYMAANRELGIVE